MKILHILNELRPSGAEVMLEVAAQVFKDNDIESDILSTGLSKGAFSERLSKKGYNIFHFPYRGWWRIVSFLFLYELYQFIKVKRYDVVHVHTERARFSLTLVSRLALVQCVVSTIHHIFPPNPGFKGYLAKQVKTIRRWLMRHVLGVQLVSNSYSGLENERKNYKSNNILIPNWFDAEKYRPPSLNEKLNARMKLCISESTLVFISLGGNWDYKNYELILDAIYRMDNKSDLLYLQVGPDQDDAPLQKKVSRLKISDNVQLAGKVDDVLIYLWAADVYIMPSSLEGFGVAAVEAMGSGLPAILSDVPALNDFKLDSDELVWINPSANDIEDKIKYFKSLKREDILSKGKQISEVIREKYGVENGVGGYINLYRHCLSSNT